MIGLLRFGSSSRRGGTKVLFLLVLVLPPPFFCLLDCMSYIDVSLQCLFLFCCVFVAFQVFGRWACWHVYHHHQGQRRRTSFSTSSPEQIGKCSKPIPHCKPHLLDCIAQGEWLRIFFFFIIIIPLRSPRVDKQNNYLSPVRVRFWCVHRFCLRPHHQQHRQHTSQNILSSRRIDFSVFGGNVCIWHDTQRRRSRKTFIHLPSLPPEWLEDIYSSKAN